MKIHRTTEKRFCKKYFARSYGFFVICILFFNFLLPASGIDLLETWTDPGTAGWTHDLSSRSGALSNPGGYLNIEFKKQYAPSILSDITRFYFNQDVFLTNISFRFLAKDVFPSAVRLYIHSKGGDNLWYVNLPAPDSGEWVTFSVPLDFSRHWIMGPNSSEDQFLRDIQSVDWLGVYVRRHGDTSAQNYEIDDFRIMGVAIPVNVLISGKVYYSGEQSGCPVKVSAVLVAGGSSTNITVTASSMGDYQFSGLPPVADYMISAYCDVNTNGINDFWEPRGEAVNNPVRLWAVDISNLDITLTDPTEPEGTPYWWLKNNFGITEPFGTGGSGGSTLASKDSDSDGMDNYSEYRAGTDPNDKSSYFEVKIGSVTNFQKHVKGVRLRWNSVLNRTYAVWRADNLLDGFIKLKGGITSTPPVNNYNDITASGKGPYYYKIEVE